MPNEQRHKYEYTVDIDSGAPAARVVRMVGREKRVLELGAGPGSITRMLRDVNDCRITAIEIDADAIKKLTPLCERVYHVDLNDVTWPRVLETEDAFDVIVAAEVFEHLYDPWSSLRSLKNLLGENTYIVASLPHAGHNGLIAGLLEEDFGYRDWGLLDRTHIRFFGLKNIQKLFNDAGLKIVEAEFVVLAPEETEFAENWYRLPSEVRRALSSNRFGSVYQVVVKAGPEDACGPNLSLLSLPVDGPQFHILNEALSFRIPVALKAKLRSALRPESRAALRRLANRFGIRIS